MRRELSVPEQLVFKKFEKENIQFIYAIRIIGSFTIEALQGAIKKLSNKHPLLTAHIEVSKKGWGNFVCNPDIELPLRIVERNHVDDWLEEEKKELKKNFDLRVGPLARFVLVRGEGVSELLLIIHHIIVDGRAATYLIKDILLCLDNPDYELKPYPLLPGIDKLIPKKWRFNPIFRSKIMWLAVKKMWALRRDGSLKENIKELSFHQNEFTVLHWELSIEQTKLLIDKSTENGVSHHATIHVAFLEAYAKTLGRSELPPFLKTPFDIRAWLSPQLKLDSLGTTFALPLPIYCVYKTRRNFWDMAKDIKKGLERVIDSNILYREIALLRALRGVSHYMMDTILPVNTGLGVSDITISNLGNLKIRAQYKTFNVDFFQGSIPMLGNQHLLGVTLFNRKFYFALMASKPKIDEVQAQQLKENFERSLAGAIGQVQQTSTINKEITVQ